MSTWNDEFEFDQWLRRKKEAEQADAERREEQRRLLAEDDRKERERVAIKTWLVRVDKGDTEYASLYLDTFIKNGYATLAKCAELTKETLDAMGVKLFHREDILRNLPKQRLDMPPAAPRAVIPPIGPRGEGPLGEKIAVLEDVVFGLELENGIEDCEKDLKKIKSRVFGYDYTGTFEGDILSTVPSRDAPFSRPKMPPDFLSHRHDMTDSERLTAWRTDFVGNCFHGKCKCKLCSRK